jgi:hypothetical protein
MASVVNLLSSESSKFTNSVGDWTSGNSALSFTRTQKREESNSSSLRIYAESATGASASAPATFIPNGYNGWPVRAFTWVNSEASGTVTIYLTEIIGGASTTASTEVGVIANNWTLLSVQIDEITPSGTSLVMEVVTTDTQLGESIYLSRPAIMSPWAAAQSFAGGEVWLRLPQYLQTTDTNQTDPDVPLFRFIESLFNVANDIDLIWQDFRWIPPEDNLKTIKVSGLVSPTAALPPALAWMSQIIGSKLLDPTATFTPWFYLDNDNNSATPISWTDWLNTVDLLGNNDGTVTWDEIQNYNPAVFDLTESFREQVIGSYYGYKAGTTDSIIAAAKAVEKVNTVTLQKHFGGDPFRMKLTILASEGGSTVDVERALVGTTPAGYQITVVSV